MSVSHNAPLTQQPSTHKLFRLGHVLLTALLLLCSLSACYSQVRLVSNPGTTYHSGDLAYSPSTQPPILVDVTDHSITVQVNATQSCRVYYQLLVSCYGRTTCLGPTADTPTAGAKGSLVNMTAPAHRTVGAVIGMFNSTYQQNFTFVIDGLVGGTYYDPYLVLANNELEEVTFTFPAAPYTFSPYNMFYVPVFDPALQYQPALNSLTLYPSSASTTATVYYMLISPDAKLQAQTAARSVAEPSLQDIRYANGTYSTNHSGVGSFSINNGIITPANRAFTGLTAATEYYLYYIVCNQQDACVGPKQLYFSTSVDAVIDAANITTLASTIAAVNVTYHFNSVVVTQKFVRAVAVPVGTTVSVYSLTDYKLLPALESSSGVRHVDIDLSALAPTTYANTCAGHIGNLSPTTPYNFYFLVGTTKSSLAVFPGAWAAQLYTFPETTGLTTADGCTVLPSDSDTTYCKGLSDSGRLIFSPFLSNLTTYDDAARAAYTTDLVTWMTTDSSRRINCKTDPAWPNNVTMCNNCLALRHRWHCANYVPHCTAYDRRRKPCRWLCEQVREVCNEVTLVCDATTTDVDDCSACSMLSPSVMLTVAVAILAILTPLLLS